MSKTKPSNKGISDLKDTLDEIFSLYIRKRDDGKCFTCPKKDNPKNMQAGHYIPRNHLSTRFDEKNVHCQCVGCNVFRKGNMDEYAMQLRWKYGNGILEELNAKKHEQVKFSRSDYELMIKIYKGKLECVTAAQA